MFRVLLLICFKLSWVLGITRPVDLSHSYDRNTPSFGKDVQFHFTKIFTNSSNNEWYAANEFETAEHSGTHLDAPYHFNRNGLRVADIPVERLIGRGVLVDLREKARLNSDYIADAKDFEDWEKQNGPIQENAIVLLDFGWAKKYNNSNDYFGTNDTKDETTYHFPGISESGAKWLVETANVLGVGTDTASIDYGQTKDYEAHKVITGHNKYILENVALPCEQLPPLGYQLLVLPMKIRFGTGAPVRIVALPENYSSALATTTV